MNVKTSAGRTCRCSSNNPLALYTDIFDEREEHSVRIAEIVAFVYNESFPANLEQW